MIQQTKANGVTTVCGSGLATRTTLAKYCAGGAYSLHAPQFSRTATDTLQSLAQYSSQRFFYSFLEFQRLNLKQTNAMGSSKDTGNTNV
mmetsp:Transcript_21449/g.35886  ORF Transcript_21449/g.35886 Transcript_21449/m.35886 type:complete len:89 (-) Transcript_21449:425-691(-)